MGNKLTESERYDLLDWCKKFHSKPVILVDPVSLSGIANSFGPDLLRYAACGQVASATRRPFKEKQQLRIHLFPVRVKLERMIRHAVLNNLKFSPEDLLSLYRNKLFGVSKKQGVSLRLGLITCEPTRLCASSCYAHDALDATPAAVVRGVLNTILIDEWCRNPNNQFLTDFLIEEIDRASRAAIKESISSTFAREPRVRLSHVGEAAAFPKFVNFVASRLLEKPEIPVRCVIYTRHSRAIELDAGNVVINYTTDASTPSKRLDNPIGSRAVSSSFNGLLDPAAEINFLEHHNRGHADPVGQGSICPVTISGSKEKSCDAARCDVCFRVPKAKAAKGV
jgi:hypothetical protein